MVANMQSESLADLSSNSLTNGSSDMQSKLIEAMLAAYSGHQYFIQQIKLSISLTSLGRLLNHIYTMQIAT